MVRAVVGEILRSAGHEVGYAKDGSEAIALYIKAMEAGDPFSAVIVDLNVPGGMGGKETVEKLLSIDPNVKAAVSSGYPNDPVMTNFRDYGFRAVLSKPFRFSELSDALRTLIPEA